MTGFILRLAGTLQSWGDHSTFAVRDTARYPTLSGLFGMFGAAEGRPRDTPPGDYTTLRMVTRVDRPGSVLVDFHTVGGGRPRSMTVPTASGKHRPEGTTTVASYRHYLTDAVFAVAVDGPAEVTSRIVAALNDPVWQPSMGRKACEPDALLVLAAKVEDPVGELRRLPLARPRRRPRPGADQDTVPVDFVTEGAGPGSRVELHDRPAGGRTFEARQVTVTTVDLPGELCAGYGCGYVDRIAEWVAGVAA